MKPRVSHVRYSLETLTWLSWINYMDQCIMK